MASGLSRTGGPSTPSAAPQSQPPHHALDDDTQEPGMACPRRAAAARLRAGGSRIGTNARKQPSPARGSSHAPDLCAGGGLMHPPVTYVGAPACPLARRHPAHARPALSLPLSVFAAALGLRVATVCTPCVRIVVIVYTAAQSHSRTTRGKESGPCRLGRPQAGKGPRWAAQASP